MTFAVSFLKDVLLILRCFNGILNSGLSCVKHKGSQKAPELLKSVTLQHTFKTGGKSLSNALLYFRIEQNEPSRYQCCDVAMQLDS